MNGEKVTTRKDWNEFKLVESGKDTTNIATSCLIMGITGVRDRSAALLGHYEYPLIEENPDNPELNPSLRGMLERSAVHFADGRLIVVRGLSPEGEDTAIGQLSRQLILSNLLLLDQRKGDTYNVEFSDSATAAEIVFDADQRKGEVLSVSCKTSSEIMMVQIHRTLRHQAIKDLASHLQPRVQEF